VIDSPSILSVIRKTTSLTSVLSTFAFKLDENAARRKCNSPPVGCASLYVVHFQSFFVVFICSTLPDTSSGDEKKKSLSASLTTKQDTPHLSRHQVSQVSAPEFQFERVMILSYQGVSRFEFQLYCLRIPFVSQGVVCSHSASLQVSWTFAVIVFKDHRGCTLFVCMYISLTFSIR
jgi:hypothetical protein